jgi:hypothetical protein
MATIQARGAAGINVMGKGFGGEAPVFSKDTPAGWHMIWWGTCVAIIMFLLWAL